VTLGQVLFVVCMTAGLVGALAVLRIRMLNGQSVLGVGLFLLLGVGVCVAVGSGWLPR